MDSSRSKRNYLLRGGKRAHDDKKEALLTCISQRAIQVGDAGALPSGCSEAVDADRLYSKMGPPSSSAAPCTLGIVVLSACRTYAKPTTRWSRSSWPRKSAQGQGIKSWLWHRLVRRACAVGCAQPQCYAWVQLVRYKC